MSIPDFGFYVGVKCFHCFDTGLTNNLLGIHTLGNCECPLVVACVDCCDSLFFKPTEAALKLQHCVAERMDTGEPIELDLFNLARILTHFTTEKPCPRAWLSSWLRLDERSTKRLIERLRAEWLMPIGSRKGEPAGHWIIVDAKDFLNWQREYRASALTMLATCHRMGKANFPELAGQTAFDFVNQITQEMGDVL